jgi:acyl-CoA thioesterase YciA
MTEDTAAPRGELAIRTVAMPADTNPAGDIFGGWLLAQMDVGGGIAAWWRANGRVATVGIEAMTFHKPVNVGDVVNVHAEVVRIGTTSITVHVEAWVESRHQDRRKVRVTEGTFTYVALDDSGRKRPVPSDEAEPSKAKRSSATKTMR